MHITKCNSLSTTTSDDLWFCVCVINFCSTTKRVGSLKVKKYYGVRETNFDRFRILKNVFRLRIWRWSRFSHLFLILIFEFCCQRVFPKFEIWRSAQNRRRLPWFTTSTKISKKNDVEKTFFKNPKFSKLKIVFD